MRFCPKSEKIPLSLEGVRAPSAPEEINDALYHGKDVKDRLEQDQCGKCIYCECRLNGDFGHIEHYRPKKGYSIPPDNTLHTPGYYWLAYDWNNLLLSCSVCNTSCKRNHFALADEATRRIAQRDISAEEPLLINPSFENPADFMEFHEHILALRSINGEESRRGRYTIDVLKLNERTDLVNNRRAVWEDYQRWCKIRSLVEGLSAQGINLPEVVELWKNAESAIRAMKGRNAEYSAMFV